MKKWIGSRLSVKGQPKASQPALPQAGENGALALKSAQSGAYLQVSPDKAHNGNPVLLGSADSDGIQWLSEYVGGSDSNVVMLKNARSGKYLHARSKNAGEQLVLADANDDGSRWYIECDAGDLVRLRSVLSGHYLAVANGKKKSGNAVVQTQAPQSRWSQWHIDCVARPPPSLCAAARAEAPAARAEAPAAAAAAAPAAAQGGLKEAASRGADLKTEQRLVLKSPACDWLGKGPKALALLGNGYKTIKDTRGHGIGIGKAVDAVALFFDGDVVESMALRKFDDRGLALEVNHRKMQAGSDLSLWDGTKMKAPSCRFVLNQDMTLSPHGHSGKLVVGAKQGAIVLCLVGPQDPLRLVFDLEAAEGILAEERARQKAKKDAEEAEQRRMLAEVAAKVSPEVLEKLRVDGFVHIPGAVSKSLVVRAKREINRELGQSGQTVDSFKAKTFAKQAEITDLFNASLIPKILERLLGPKKYSLGSGQIALRFPGDFCPQGNVSMKPDAFEGVRRGWHIDGCPNPFIPGTTDHYGQVKNFDALCGVLLSDLSEPMGGELCCYPGSHMELAEYFKKEGRLDKLAAKGMDELPTGEKTDGVLRGKVRHCIGRAGDVFIANYMVAHFIAPNTQSDIRYAVYFRATGPQWKDWKPPMLNPLMHWHLSASPSKVPARKGNSGSEDQENELDDYYSVANNDHTAPAFLQRSVSRLSIGVPH